MKLTHKRLKKIIKEEILTERLRRFKVYVSGESQPLVLMGKNEREVKKLAHMMIRNSSVRIRKVVREINLNELSEKNKNESTWTWIYKGLLSGFKKAKDGRLEVVARAVSFFIKTEFGIGAKNDFIKAFKKSL